MDSIREGKERASIGKRDRIQVSSKDHKMLQLVDSQVVWRQAHAGHVDFKTVTYRNKKRKLNLSLAFVEQQLKECRIYQKKSSM